MSTIREELARQGIELPQAAAPVASYVPVVIAGGLAHVSGQLPFVGGELVKGKLGAAVTLDKGNEAARACGLMILAQMDAAGIAFEQIGRVVKLGAFIASAEGFTDQPKVANGASDLMVSVFGDKGRHARSAVGVPELPLGAAVEVDAIFALADR